MTSQSINGFGGEGSVVDPDPDGSASNKNPDRDRDPDTHQSDKLHPDTHQSDKVDPEPDPHQFADDKQRMYGI